MTNYISRGAAILGEKQTASPEARRRTVRKCCLVCFALLLVPALEMLCVFVFHRWPGLWLGTVPWVLSAALGILFGLQACSLADRRADGFPLVAFGFHFLSLLVLLIGAMLAVSAP
jgi:hypothetical protein